jgi:hypothetical protein
VDPSIISGAAGLGGALIGGSATIAAGWLQQKRQTKNDRSRELRERQEDAARTCQQALWDIEAVLDENFDNLAATDRAAPKGFWLGIGLRGSVRSLNAVWRIFGASAG